MSTVTYKTCNKCSTEKPIANFYRKSNSSDGYNGICKDCLKERHATYYKDNNEKIRARRRNYGRMYRYGISENDVIEMVKSQDGKCLICEKEIDSSSHVDHDHATGKIRGILCKECNIGLGMFLDNPGTIIRAADYLLDRYECEEDIV